jgi:ribonuclease inhibitor
MEITMRLVIDGEKIFTEEDFHDEIVRGLELPTWYGRNLDALWDVLTGMMDRPIELVWLNSQISQQRLSRYDAIISLLKDVEKRDKDMQRPNAFTLRIE